MDTKDFQDMEDLASGLRKSIGMATPKISLVDFFHKVCDLMNSHQLKVVVAGGIAYSSWVTPRLTTDLDLVLSGDLTRISKILEDAGFIKGSDFTLAQGQVRIIRFLYQDRELDLLEFKNTEFQNWVLQSARKARTLGREVYIASPEALLLMKAFSSRTKDKADIEELWPLVDKTIVEDWSKKLGLKLPT